VALVLSCKLPSRKLARYSRDFVATVHLRYALANRMAGIFPEFVSGAVRARLYRLAGFGVDSTAFIMGDLALSSGLPFFYDKLRIDKDVVIGTHVAINLDAEVWIGRSVSIGPYVLIYTGTHQIGPGSNRRIGEVIAKPVRIEDGCWIGLAARILPGVTVGHGSVVAAGAVVTQDVPPNCLVEGNPAQVVRQLPWGDR
jgi:maltose O-acetyltransferase